MNMKVNNRQCSLASLKSRLEDKYSIFIKRLFVGIVASLCKVEYRIYIPGHGWGIRDFWQAYYFSSTDTVATGSFKLKFGWGHLNLFTI